MAVTAPGGERERKCNFLLNIHNLQCEDLLLFDGLIMCIPQNESAKLERSMCLTDSATSLITDPMLLWTGHQRSIICTDWDSEMNKSTEHDLGQICLAVEQPDTEGRKPTGQRTCTSVKLKANGNPGILSSRHLPPWPFKDNKLRISWGSWVNQKEN